MKLQLLIKYWPGQYISLLKKNEYNQKVTNSIVKLNNTLRLLKQIYLHQNKIKSTFLKAINDLNLTKYKSRLYAYDKKLSEITNRDQMVFLIPKLTGPKKIKYIYNEQARKVIANEHFNQHYSKSVVWWRYKTFNNSSIAYNTVLKIIRNDSRYVGPKTIAKIKHPLRLYDLEFGNIQMDLKIIGPKQSPTGKRITVFDAKDEQSKLYYMEPIANGSKENLISATVNMINHFNNLGMKIIRVRTDNAMIFKENNFVTSYEFHNLLKSHNIKLEHIPKKQPQCNGVIERQHKTLDVEFVKSIKQNDNFEMIKLRGKNYMNFHNFSRPHYMTFLSKYSDYNTFYSRFQIPFNFFRKHFNTPPITNTNTPILIEKILCMETVI